MSLTAFYHPAWVEINLAHFKKNIAAIRHHIGHTKFCLPVKANAYGHGLIPVAYAAVEAGVDYLAVSCLQEGALLREAGIHIPILVLGAIHDEQITELIHHQLEITIASRYKAELVAKKCSQLQQTCRVHIEVDTGMQRTGVKCETALDLLNYLEQFSCFEIVGIYSHLATADNPHHEFADYQIRLFRQFVAEKILPKKPHIIAHLANSGGVCYFPESYMNMVRPGLLAFGYFPNACDPAISGIEPCFSLKARIAYFKIVEKNQGISYGHTYKTSDKTRVITVPVGYGDGYRRSLSNRAHVLVRGQRYRVSGTVCMDQFMVDIGQHEAHIGEEVTLIGKQQQEEITLQEMAAWCDTIPYEILCAFNDRLPRRYI